MRLFFQKRIQLLVIACLILGLGLFRTEAVFAKQHQNPGDYSTIGVDLYTLSKQLGKMVGVPKGQGVMIIRVFPDTPAKAADLKAGDIILEANEQKYQNSSDLRRIIDNMPADTPVHFTILHHGEITHRRIAPVQAVSIENPEFQEFNLLLIQTDLLIDKINDNRFNPNTSHMYMHSLIDLLTTYETQAKNTGHALQAAKYTDGIRYYKSLINRWH